MMRSKIRELYALEQLSGGKSFVHKLHPNAKLAVTLIFILTIVSFDQYSFNRLIPYVFYPTLLMALSDTPYFLLFERFLVVLPFCLFAGVSSLIFNRVPALVTGDIVVSYGMISFCTILFRTYLCVMAVLLLMAVTPFADITDAMRRMKIPAVAVILFEITYRYLGVLFEEASSMYTAYSLRNNGGKGIALRDMGSFTGQLLLRSFDRAERVYQAMKCRGYMDHGRLKVSRPYTAGDKVFCLLLILLCVLFRTVDVGVMMYKLFGGLN